MKGLKNIISLLLVVVLLSGGLIIGIDNNSIQTLTILDWHTPALPLYQWLFIFLVIGFVLGLLFTFKTIVTLQFRIANLNKQLKVKTSEAAMLGNVQPESEVK